jgi:hypothetical protein
LPTTDKEIGRPSFGFVVSIIFTGSHRDLSEKYRAILENILTLGEDELVDGLKVTSTYEPPTILTFPVVPAFSVQYDILNIFYSEVSYL